MALACVLDASAAVRLILGDPAAAGVTEQIREAALVMLPELMLSEVANTLWKLHRARKLADLNPHQLLADARDLVDRVEPDRHLQSEALVRREATTLISMDRRLQQLAERVLP
ncbi:type II toxin-antitoxin system VapC family toxin [Synechococcus sp. RedBA-s]|uniref:type II toxin-antitoxin system VapC family toxin n=1 Tax=Synechococcus sp. RedBA-s TaxID=2823741 RepID=UPI0020CE55DD|nr:type II toxin-antitoxin system VapC family toxin [Synechococcus sp. RedBA-s]